MGLFGGGNSKSSTTNNATEINRNLADYSQVDGAQTKSDLDISGSSNTTNLTILDGGAIKGAFDFSGATVTKALESNEEMFKQLGAAGQRETELAMNALKSSSPLASDTAISTDLIKYGAIALVVVVVAFIAFKGKK